MLQFILNTAPYTIILKKPNQKTLKQKHQYNKRNEEVLVVAVAEAILEDSDVAEPEGCVGIPVRK